MTTRSDQDINASTSIHVSRTQTQKVSGTPDQDTDELNAAERAAQLSDLAARHGQPIKAAVYPVSPSQDATRSSKAK